MKMSLFTYGINLLLKRGSQLAKFSKNLHVSRVSCQVEIKCEEIRIPVPWGYIAGKWWGPQDKRPLLCLHGWQESCSSFDPLLQLLSADTGFLAIDWPGHGHSSHLPKGMYYHGIDWSILIRRIQKYFNWPTISFLAHSMSGGHGLLFTSLYPNDVDMLIQIDGFKPFSYTAGSGIQSTAMNLDVFLRYDDINNSNTPPPTYSYDEAMHKLLEGTLFTDSLAPHSAKYVLDRTIAKSEQDPARYVFLRDIRTKGDIFMWMQHDDICEYAKSIKCPMLSIKSSESSYYEKKCYVDDIVTVLKKHNKYFELVFVEGTHHVHVNTPEIVAPIVSEFLAKYNQK